MDLVVQLDPSIEFSRRENDVTSYIGQDRRTGKYFRFGAAEFHAAKLLDGTKDISAVTDQLYRDGVQWSGFETLTFARQLIEHRLASINETTDRPGGPSASPASALATPPGQTPPPGQAPPAKSGMKGLARIVRLLSGTLSQRFPLFNGDRVAEFLLPSMGPLFSKPAMLLWTLLVVSGVGIAWTQSKELVEELYRVFDQQLWLYMAVIWCALKFIHECGHAVSAKIHGVRVGKMGIMFFLMAPLAFVDVTDAWKLVQRRKRVQIALAGVYLELAIGAIAAWAWWMCPIGFWKHLSAQIFFVAGPATLLVNANPLLRLDGYYVMSDLLEIPNLRSVGRKRLREWIERILLGMPMPDCTLVGWRRDVATTHAICSVVFQVIWMGGLLFAVSHFAEGPGMRFIGIGLAVIAAVLWGILPLARWTWKIWRMEQPRGWVLGSYQGRLLSGCLFLILPIQWASSSASPFSRKIPVVTRYQGEQIARAAAEAFVVALYVQCGDRVEKGTLLMELENPELVVKRDQLQDQLALAKAKATQHRRRGEIALAEAEQERAESLSRQIGDVADQLSSLQVVASRGGKITTPHTDHLLGRYVHQGDELLRVCDPQRKEILALISEKDSEAFRQSADVGRTAAIRLRGGVRLDASLCPPDPSATRYLPHPALAASAGGPLAVEPSDSEQFELVRPHLSAVLPLDPLASLKVRAGQIGRLTIPDDRTFLSRLWDYLSES
ncbi:MAG: efflux RND transporter periplasmic adaptor subunit [Planctomycetota bacterium]